jgi:superfamily I DNA/RNA helicase
LTAECRYLAQEFRRAHFLDGVPWSEMAVLVRSPGARVAALQRAFAAEGVPVAVDAAALALADQPSVAPLIAMARIALDERHLTPERAEMLLLSAYGGADPLLLRRLRQEFRAVAAGYAARAVAEPRRFARINADQPRERVWAAIAAEFVQRGWLPAPAASGPSAT